jgi:DNA-binding winged helix-turn-helix (wHTH) protein/tetratricopeptide (TPR) repeat protein
MTQQPFLAERYEFDRFGLSADGTLLLRDGVVVPMPPKVLRTLLVLVQRAGEVVRKEDLLRAVWPDSFVAEIGLARNISLLRQALGADGPRFIVTVARIGYRFTGAVQRIEYAKPLTGSRVKSELEEPSHHEPGQLVVGRQQELTVLREALARARAGHGSLLAVAGEPGIGKTTVVESLLAEVANTAGLGRGRCSERLAGAEPHLPLLEALDALTGATPELVETLRRTAPTWADHVRPGYHSDRQGTAQDDRRQAGSPERLMRELTSFLEAASRQRTVVLFVDDLHWADLSTIDALTYLAPRVTSQRVLVILAYRQREILLKKHPFGRLRSELIARGDLRELAVSLLGLSDVRDYVRLTVGGDVVASRLASQVFERTEGNPLFMTELVRYLRHRTSSEPDLSFVRDVPDSLRGVIDRTLDELDSVTRELLSIAAVRGYEFDSATVSRVSGVVASEVEDRLRNADLTYGLVRRVREHELPDGTPTLVCHFAHVLYQNALIDAVAPSKRIDWARKSAAALRASHGEATAAIAGSLATLFEAGREFWEASEWFLGTSRNAVRLFAFATASELAGRGLTCLSSVRAISPRLLQQRELDLTFARLLPLASLEGYASSEVGRLTRRVVELAETLTDVPATAAALSATWIVRMVRGECLAAKQAGTRLAALAEAAHDDVLLINARMHAQIACHHLGDFREARRYAAAVAEMADRTPPSSRCVGVLDPVVASLAESARNQWITGHLSGALADCEAAVTVGRDVRHPDSLAFAWLFHGWIHGYAGDWATCLASTAAGIAIAGESGSVQTLVWNRGVRGWALAHVGDYEKGASELATAIDDSKAILGRIALPQFHAMLAEVCLLRGDVAAAETCLGRAAELEQSHDDRYFAAEVHRLSAVCLARRAESKSARARLQAALEISRAQGAATFELRAALTLSELDPRKGSVAVQSAMSAFPEPRDWPEIRAAHRLPSAI